MCAKLSRKYRRMTTIARILSVSMGSSSGIVAVYAWQYGIAVGCLGAVIGVLEHILKWSQLSEKYATLKCEFEMLIFSYNEDKYNELRLRFESAMLEQDMI